MGLSHRRMMLLAGKENEEVKEWKLLRTITVPETVESDNGINWIEQTNGGFLFGFDTDDNGNSFYVGELFVRYEAGTSKSEIIQNSTRINTSNAIPIYTAGNSHSLINVPSTFGKSGSKIYGWFKVERIAERVITYGAYNGGSTYMNELACRDAAIAKRIEKISMILVNNQGYGFETGSTFEIYGR